MKNHGYHISKTCLHAGNWKGCWFWFSFRALPAIVVASIAIMLLTITPARALGLKPDGVEAGQMLLGTGASGELEAALIQSARVHFDISGMIATVTLEQTFRNNTEQWVEGVYAFPLPEQAAVRYMEMIIGERRIVGKIKEKSIAKKIYAEAKKAGKKASLVEQQRPNLFTNKVANIGPGEDITVRLEYVQTLAYSKGEFSLRFPTTITPRYMPDGGSQQAVVAKQQVLDIDSYLGWALPAVEGALRNRIEITASLDVGMPLAKIEADYHEITLTRKKGLYDIELTEGGSEMDRDFVLHWKPVTGSAPNAAIFTEQIGEDFYGLLMLVPPELAASSEESVLAREMVFVIDTSGSMGGESIVQARQSLTMALAQLRPQDSFNIIEFNSQHRALFRASEPASRHYLQKAGEFIRQLNASGGTEMLPALRAALTVSEERAGVRQVIFITDGAIGNERQLFEEIQSKLNDSRLFTVAIGSAPNSWFMRKAAQFGRGTHIHIGAPGEVAEKMQILFEQISTPLTVDIEITWPDEVEAYPHRVPDLFQGQPVTVAFKFDAGQLSNKIEMSGQMASQAWFRALKLKGSDSSGVASVWAREKISALLDQKLMAKDEDEEQLREQVLNVALKHNLMSPYTSFVAVEELISRPGGTPLDNVKVANTQPKGQSPQGIAYPATATTGPANLFLGGLFLFLVMMIHVMRQPEVDCDSNPED